MLTKDDMTHLARLARLAPSPDELAKFGAQCADVVSYMDVLNEVDVSGTEPLYSPVAHATPYRADEPERRRDRAEILANAPETDGRFFVVPRIV